MLCVVEDEPDGSYVELVTDESGGYCLRHLLTEEWADIASAGDSVVLEVVEGWAVVQKNNQAMRVRDIFKSSVHTGDDGVAHVRRGGVCQSLNELRRSYKVVAGAIADSDLKYKAGFSQSIRSHSLPSLPLPSGERLST